MSSSISNCWMYFLAAASPWKSIKRTSFVLSKLFRHFFFFFSSSSSSFSSFLLFLLLPPLPHKSGGPASPHNSPSIIVFAFHTSFFLYWHLKAWVIHISSGCKWLVQFGGRNITLIFFRALLSRGFAAHWSMKSKIFLYFAPVWRSNCTRHFSKVA